MRLPRLSALIAAAAVAGALGILWPVGGAASLTRSAASSTYNDATGDAAGGGPDVQTVTVSDDSSGKISFTATIANRPALTDEDAVQAFFDTDANAGTGGSGGFEYEVAWISGHQLLLHWDGSQFADLTSTTFSAAYKDGTASFTADKADLGGSTTFAFIVTTTGDTGDSRSDRGPDGSAEWTYPAPAGGSPPPPPPPGSPPAPPPPSGATLATSKFNVTTPHAGRPFTVSMVVRVSQTGIAVRTGVSCSAKLAGKKLVASRKGSVQSGRASCTWKLPKGSVGKQLKGSITSNYQGAKVSKPFSARVRG